MSLTRTATASSTSSSIFYRRSCYGGSSPGRYGWISSKGKFDRFAEWVSFAAAFVWALHPVNTESVVYITQRTELMMGLFYPWRHFISVFSTGRRRARRHARWLLTAATLACVSGMLSKEMMASAPAMVLLYDRTFIAGSFHRALKRSWPLYVGLALTWGTAICAEFRRGSYAGGRIRPGESRRTNGGSHRAKVLFLYLKLAVWPWPLVIHYEIPYLKTAAEAWPGF